MSSTMYQPGVNTDQTLIFKGQVVSVPDSITGYEPIKCNIQLSDSTIKDGNDLAVCYPLLPSHLNVYPKVGEWVYILNINKDNNQQIRYFLGPIIDVFKNLGGNEDDNRETNSNIKPSVSITPDKGIYPKRDEISIQGRYNSDVIFKNQEVLIRAGKYVAGNPIKFNSIDTAYIQLRYGEPKLKETNKTKIITEVKLIEPEGFAIATLTQILVSGVVNWDVFIRLENKNNVFIGKLNQSFTDENTAIFFIKNTFITLQKNETQTINLFSDDFGNKINNIYDFSKFKFINDKIPQLRTFSINQLTEKVTKTVTVPETETIFESSKGSVVNVVGNKINLISHGNKDGFKLLDSTMTITPEQQLKINTESQPIPYGYLLNDFLKLIKTFVANHVHAYPGLPPDVDPIVETILNYDLETILNQNVRTA